MTTNHHTALSYRGALTSAAMESPLAELDEALGVYGTWTPVPTFLTAGTSSWTPDASYTYGAYHRIGDRVFLDAFVLGTFNKGTASGLFLITGLPFDRWSQDADPVYGPYPAGAFSIAGTSVVTERASSYGLTSSVEYESSLSAFGIEAVWNGTAIGSSGYLSASDFASGDLTIAFQTSANYRIA